MKSTKLITGLLFTALFSILISVLFSIPFLPLFAAITALGMLVPGEVALRTIVSNPLIGASRKSMGNATFSNWKGIYVLKTKPISVANPNTGAQIQQRSAFRQLVQAFREMPAAIRIGFKELAIKQSAFNAFMSYNLKNAFDFSVPGVATIDSSLLLTSKGTIAKTEATTAVADASLLTIVVDFPATATQPGQSLTDLAVISAYNETLDQFTGGVTDDLRSSGQGTIDMPGNWVAGNVLTVYLGFSNSLTGASSDSDIATATVIA